MAGSVGGLAGDGGGQGEKSGVHGEESWGSVVEYFDLLRRALACLGGAAMVWSLRAACDPAADAAMLLREELELDGAAASKAEVVLAAAASLHEWLPLDGISGRAWLPIASVGKTVSVGWSGC
jgi:hypothetical protein